VRKRFTTILIVVSVWLCVSVVSVQSLPTQTSQISFINVGQGDSALLRDSNGFDVLIDGGPTSAGATVVDYLRSQGVDNLEVMLNTHADADHVGGLVTVLEAVDISVGAIYYNGYPGTTQTWNNFVSQADLRSIPMIAAQFPSEYNWGDFSVYILNPTTGLSDPEQNDVSVVARIDFLDTQFLFPGDIDSSIEAAVIARQTPIAADVLKVAHHGSAYGSSEQFLAAVQPANGVISVGDNSYGHPAPENLTRLANAGIQVWRTDQQGTIQVTSDGFAVTFPGQGPVPGYRIYLPAVVKPDQPGPNPTLDVRITSILADGSGSNEPDEYVEFKNFGTASAALAGWTLRDDANHIYTFPSFNLQVGQVCRVYTNQNQPGYCGFSYASASAIWNNTGDCAYLRDDQNQPVSQKCY
jgi:beta-lactamase superfamily II metal-dependent hydrolase